MSRYIVLTVNLYMQKNKKKLYAYGKLKYTENSTS